MEEKKVQGNPQSFGMEKEVKFQVNFEKFQRKRKKRYFPHKSNLSSDIFHPISIPSILAAFLDSLSVEGMAT